MSLEKAKKIVVFFISLSIVACVGGLVFFQSGSTESSYAALAALISLMLSIAVALKWCRCPWCGHVLFRKLFSLKVCPECHRDLTTGKKKKGKGGR
jgi:hypothetical protein